MKKILTDCSICSKVKNGTLHSFQKEDGVGKWYKCDRCHKTITFRMMEE